MNRSDLQSLALHQAAAAKLRRQPELWAKVHHNVQRMVQSPGLAAPWGRRWQDLLKAPHEQVLAFICEDSDQAQQYRSSSPFSGVLTARERLAALASANHETRAA